MDEKKYTITLSDGTVLENLSLNGNNFITNEKITEETFAGNCSPVVFSDGENEEVHEHMTLVAINSYKAGEYHFILRDYSDKELELMQMQSDIEYLAMMSNIDL